MREGGPISDEERPSGSSQPKPPPPPPLTVSIPFGCADARRNPATRGANQGSPKRRFDLAATFVRRLRPNSRFHLPYIAGMEWYTLMLIGTCGYSVPAIEGSYRCPPQAGANQGDRNRRFDQTKLSHGMYLLISVRESSPPHNRQLIVYYYLQQVDCFVGESTF